MGDITNMHDIERFVRSPEGSAYLEEIRNSLEGKTIDEVTFSNEVHFLATNLHLDDGEVFVVFQPSLEVGTIQHEFEEVIDREYKLDFPERK